MPYQHTEVTRPIGINKDLSPYELRNETWSDGRNVAFDRQRCQSMKGYENVFDFTDTVIDPLFLIYYTDNIDRFWIYASEAAIYNTDGFTVNSIGSGYSATREVNWNGTNFNSLIVMNNRNDHPQVLDPTAVQNEESFIGQMIDLPNWAGPSPWGAASRAKVIRGYKNYLFALDCYNENGTRYPSMVRWSSPAAAGDVPPSWDPVDPAEQAGLYTLADTPGAIVDGLTLSDYFVIYKTDSVWLVQFIGGSFVMSFRKLFGDEAGCLGTDCIAEFNGKHFVLSTTGAYTHNGATKQEVMEPWVKDEFFKNVSRDRLLETKVVADHNKQEIWIYYVTDQAYLNNPNAWPDKALVWHWDVQEWALKDLTGISHIAEGVVEPTIQGLDDSWDAATGSWDTDLPAWNIQSSAQQTIGKGLLLADYTNNLLYANDYTNDHAGEPQLKWVERIGIDFDDDQTYKYIARITPHIIGQNPVTIKMFAEDNQTGKPTQVFETEFNPINQQWTDCHFLGRYVGIRFESYNQFILTGYSLEWETAGTV
mgnify:CR=1 FL=1